MNPLVDPLHAGIAGVTMEMSEFDLGEGLVLRQTFAHFMAPFLMAFAPAEGGKPHPAPWSAVSGGLGFDINVELFVPASFNRPRFFDRLNTVWWITALIRLRGGFRAHAPVIADRPVAEFSKVWKNAAMLPVEILERKMFGKSVLERLTLPDLMWLKEKWLRGGQLMNEQPKLNDAFQALDAAGSLPNPAVSLLAVWGALEHLFSPAKQELRFRVSANIAAYLESHGQTRLNLHRRLMKLYDARSGVAHGVKTDSFEAWSETFAIANQILIKILDSGEVPTKDSLEKQLFAGAIVSEPSSLESNSDMNGEADSIH